VMPSENDSPLETKSRKPTEQEFLLQAWERQVRQALHGDDSEALRNLFAELSGLVPTESVSHEWLRVVSGWDAEAMTG
jgi:hypothetical protein